jgi:hypothetical protein
MPQLTDDARDGRVYNFGNTQPMPEGYRVIWHKSCRKYQGHGPDGWETEPTDDQFEARYLCIEHASPEKVDIWDRWYSRIVCKGLVVEKRIVLLYRLWKSPAYRRGCL